MIKVKNGTKFPLTVELVNCLDLTEERIIAYGESVDSPEGINMAGTKQTITWVLVASAFELGVYVSASFGEMHLEEVYRFGDKVCLTSTLKNIIEFTEKTEQMYKHGL